MTEAIALKNVSVTVGMPVGKPIPPQTVAALWATAYQLGWMRLRADLAIQVCGVITIGRDSVLDEFLKTDTDKLFWIDSDQVWTPDDFLRMLALSTKYDIVGAAYPVKKDGPTIFYVNAGPVEELSSNEHGLIPINGLGLGFTIIDRKACERLAAQAPRVIDLDGREMAEVFRVDKTAAGHRRTEDIAFFNDLQALGYDIWCDPTIELGHVGEREWRGRLFDAFPTTETTS